MVKFERKLIIMKKVLALLVFTGMFLNISCKEKKEIEEQTKMDQVMEIHNEAMDKMNDITKLVAELKSKVDTTEMGQKYEVAMKDLQAAHQSMMDWMQNFGTRFDFAEVMEGQELNEQKKLWLDEEEVKVQEVKEQIDGSIERAKALLGGSENWSIVPS